jgi:UDP-N-acetylglucosamine 4,6-dehydratase/5-epimerase
MSIFDGKSVLVTGGTGSFGKRFIQEVLATSEPKRVIILSRDELKQHEMQLKYPHDSRLRFFLGDVRDVDRLRRAFDGVEYVVHAAALKQVPAAEYNPFEAVKTNILGAQNIIEAAIDVGVRRVVALSTDKASSPVNLYGATKLVSDKLFIAGNAYSGSRDTRFSVVRYGNVVGSRGSVVPLFRQLGVEKAEIPVTDERMTRFWLTLDRGVQVVIDTLVEMQGGELVVPKIPSMRVVDLATALAPHSKIRIVGIRPGEKLHEEMISTDDARRTMEFTDKYVLNSEAFGSKLEGGRSVADGFSYSSDTNDHWLDVADLRELSSSAA